MARRDPTMRLNSVDFPTLGRPTMAIVGTPTVAGALIELGLIRVKIYHDCVRTGLRPARRAQLGGLDLPRQKSRRGPDRSKTRPHISVFKPAVAYYRDSVAPTSQPVSTAAPSAKKQEVSLYQFFAPGGVLSRTHPAYEFRRGQLQMAQSVEQALEEKRHLIVEAGTGTGKTLAYLVPVIRSGKRV